MRVEEGSFGVPTLTHWLLPMLNHLVIRSPAKEMDVAEEAVHTLRAVAARLPWRAYLASLLGLMRLLRLQPSSRSGSCARWSPCSTSSTSTSRRRKAPALAARHEAQDADQPKLSLGAAALRRAAAPLRGAGPRAVALGRRERDRASRRGEEGRGGRGGGRGGEEGEEAAVPETAAEITLPPPPPPPLPPPVWPGRGPRASWPSRLIRNTVRGKLPQLCAPRDPKSENLRVPVAMAVLKLLPAAALSWG